MTRLTDGWVSAPAPSAVMAALQGEAFFVGGCVRNALMRRAIKDIDVATPLVPEVVADRLHAAGIRTVPTGLAHGTQTAVVDGVGIEVTTFRADIATDGRRAEVAFTTDMAVDAARRDFTMNALYADRSGTVIDPLGGLPDLEAGCLRFIGLPEDRIREDYLRILRFFRFHAWYGADGLDADGLAACAALADGINGLARERIGWEFRKLLAAPDPAPATASMAASGVLARCLPGANPALLAPLVHLEQTAGHEARWMTRLAALGGQDQAEHLRLSRSEERLLGRITAAMEDTGTAEVLAYRHGAPAAIAARLVMAAAGNALPEPDLVADAERGARRQLPVQARDLITAGFAPGPELGAALAAAKAAWIESGFSLDKGALIGEVRSRS